MSAKLNMKSLTCREDARRMHSVDSPTAAPPLKRVKVSEIEIQTSGTIETLEKKERDQNELCAKLQEYRTIYREKDV